MLATKNSDCKMQTGFGQIGKIGECGCRTGKPQDLAQNYAQQLPLPVRANRIEIVRIGAQRIEAPQILHNGSRLISSRSCGRRIKSSPAKRLASKVFTSNSSNRGFATRSSKSKLRKPYACTNRTN